MGKFKSILIFGAMVSLVASGAYAEDLAVPHSFSSGTTIRSSEMNENFDVLYQKINRMQQQIDSYHNNVLTEGLVAYYPFNGNANDESGNGNNGTVNGATLTTDRFGNINEAFSFDGDDYIEISDSSALRPEKISVSVWVKIETVANNYSRILSKHVNIFNSYGSYQLITGSKTDETLRPENPLFTLITSEKYGFSLPKSSTNLSFNEWVSVMGVFNGDVAKTYYNGVLEGQYNDSGSILYDAGSLYIGRDGYHNEACFIGVIDDIRIYNRALSTSEIQELYNAEKP